MLRAAERWALRPLSGGLQCCLAAGSEVAAEDFSQPSTSSPRPLASGADDLIFTSVHLQAIGTFRRAMASLVRSGVPSPRHDVAIKLSSHHGGHIANMLQVAGSLQELDRELWSCRTRLRPVHVAVAASRLEALFRAERGSPYALQVQRLAGEIGKLAGVHADRLTASQIGNVVRGLGAVGHRLPQDQLMHLAAVLVADGCARLRYALDLDVRDIAFGFAEQGFVNPLFWQRLGDCLAPRVATFSPNTLPSLLAAFHKAASSAASAAAPHGSAPHAGLQAACAAALGARAADLSPARLSEALEVMALPPTPATSGAADAYAELRPKLLAQLEGRGTACLEELSPRMLATLALSLCRLGALRAASSSEPSTASAPDSAPTTTTASAPAPAARSAQFQQLLQALAPRLAAGADELAMLHLRRACQALVMARHADPGSPVANESPSGGAGAPSNSATGTSAPAPAAPVHVYGALAGRAAALARMAPSREAGSAGLMEGVARSFSLAVEAGLVDKRAKWVEELFSALGPAVRSTSMRAPLPPAAQAKLVASFERVGQAHLLN